MQSIQEDGPGRLKHLDEDVVVDIGDKVGHLMVSQVKAVELRLKIGAQPSELLLIAHGIAPG